MKDVVAGVVIFVCGVTLGVASVPAPYVAMRDAVEDLERCIESLEVGVTIATQIRNRASETLELAWPELQHRSESIGQASDEYRRISARRSAAAAMVTQ